MPPFRLISDLSSAGVLGFYEELWRLINLRNDRQSYREGLFMLDIATFNESAVREAILNAVSHRDYRHGGSIFVRQFPRKLTTVSPGGFPPGINPVVVGSAVRALAVAKIIRKDGSQNSKRKQAHARPNAVWKLADRAAVAWLAANPPMPAA